VINLHRCSVNFRTWYNNRHCWDFFVAELTPGLAPIVSSSSLILCLLAIKIRITRLIDFLHYAEKHRSFVDSALMSFRSVETWGSHYITSARDATRSSIRGGIFHELSFDDVIVLIQLWYNFFANGHRYVLFANISENENFLVFIRPVTKGRIPL